LRDFTSWPLQIKADVETQGEFVQSLAAAVRTAFYTNIEDVIAFVTWLDNELSFLVWIQNTSLNQLLNAKPINSSFSGFLFFLSK
jgi:hypothetical protein